MKLTILWNNFFLKIVKDNFQRLNEETVWWKHIPHHTNENNHQINLCWYEIICEYKVYSIQFETRNIWYLFKTSFITGFHLRGSYQFRAFTKRWTTSSATFMSMIANMGNLDEFFIDNLMCSIMEPIIRKTKLFGAHSPLSPCLFLPFSWNPGSLPVKNASIFVGLFG
jgi:hypothetical protein